MSSSRPLNLLIVTRWLHAEPVGGVENYVALASAAIRKRGMAIRYAAMMPGTQPTFAVERVHMGAAESPKWRNGLRLYRWIVDNAVQFDVVHIDEVLDWHFLAAACACRRTGTPYVVKPHGGLLPAQLQLKRGRRIKAGLFFLLAGRHLLRHAALLVAGSSPEADSLKRVARGLDIRRVVQGTSIPSSPGALPAGESRGADNLNLLFVGRFDPIKALPVLFSAVAQLKTRTRRFVLHLAGSGKADYEDMLRQLSRSLDIDEQLNWHGYVSGDDKSTLLRNSQVLVLPSYSENFGYVVAEAAAQGLPCVISDGVGLAEIVRRYDAGLIVPAGDSAALAAALEACLDVDLRLRQGRNAYDCAVNEYSVETMGRQLEEVYRDAAGTR